MRGNERTELLHIGRAVGPEALVVKLPRTLHGAKLLGLLKGILRIGVLAEHSQRIDLVLRANASSYTWVNYVNHRGYS